MLVQYAFRCFLGYISLVKNNTPPTPSWKGRFCFKRFSHNFNEHAHGISKCLLKKAIDFLRKELERCVCQSDTEVNAFVAKKKKKSANVYFSEHDEMHNTLKL